MNKNKLFLNGILIAALLVSTLLSGCSGAGAISTYTISLDEMPENLDAQVATAPQEILVLTNIFDGLYDFVDGAAAENLAQSCTISQNGLEYTFTIKNTSSFYAKGSDAVPVTARDFKFSFDRILNPDTHSPYYDTFQNIKQVEAVDDYTLRITLAKQDGNFLDLLCLPAAS
ncbi:MAG: ABC transporter substrate-binding protein, partial [Oscillospiraceae bacterium]